MGEYDDLLAYGKPATAAPAATPPAAPPVPGLWDRFTDRLERGATRIGRTVAEGATTLGGLASDEISSLPGSFLSVIKGGPKTDTLTTNPQARRELLRGADQMVTLGYGQKLANRLGTALGDTPEASLAATEAADREAAPGVREAGQLLGSFTPGAASAIARGGGALVKGATAGLKASSLPAAAGLGLVRGVGGYEATAPLTSALSADAEGHRLDVAREAATDPAGLLLAGGMGSAGGTLGRLSEEAPGRVLARAKRDLTTGEQNAGKRKTEKLAQAAGPEDEKLKALFGHDPDLYKEVATQAKAHPGRVAGAVADKQTEVSGKLDDIYGKMEAADRLVTPTDIATEFDKLVGEKLKAGDQPALAIIRRERARFLDEYGQFGKLGAETMRGLKATAGKGAFEGMPIPGSIKQDIWGVYSKAIERQAKGTPGVDLDELRGLNKDMSVLIPAHDALKERATAQAADRKSIGSHIGHAALAGAGFAHGGLKEAAIGLALPAAAKAAGQGLRRADFELARRFQGKNPDFASGAGARAAELDYAARVSEGMRNGLSLEDATKAADQEAR